MLVWRCSQGDVFIIIQANYVGSGFWRLFGGAGKVLLWALVWVVLLRVLLGVLKVVCWLLTVLVWRCSQGGVEISRAIWGLCL